MRRLPLAAKREGMPCLPYARELIRLGLRGAGARLGQVDPLLCRQLLADAFADADWESRFLTGSWQTLVLRGMPLLAERVVRTFGGSHFRPADLFSAEPISVYLLSERDMRGLDLPDVPEPVPLRWVSTRRLSLRLLAAQSEQVCTRTAEAMQTVSTIVVVHDTAAPEARQLMALCAEHLVVLQAGVRWAGGLVSTRWWEAAACWCVRHARSSLNSR